MGNAAVGEELAGMDELEEFYGLNASELDDEDDDDDYSEDDDEDEEDYDENEED